ncbi:protealysin inhibitor emfourin [Curtobacterium sp. RRHDQ10]|uniref:protealysin inhibitor emfourin n=1 Tax=Curtobacterium phyllosphaerae TaxID=3413379 RepID=UPI003BEFCE85
MDIVVRRTGGVTGMTRTWRTDSAAVGEDTDWAALVDTIRSAVPPTSAPAVRDDFTWTITVDSASVSVPGSQLAEPLAGLVARVCAPTA